MRGDEDIAIKKGFMKTIRFNGFVAVIDVRLYP